MDRELEIGIFQLFAEIAPSVIWVEVRFKSVLYIQSKRVIFTPGKSQRVGSKSPVLRRRRSCSKHEA